MADTLYKKIVAESYSQNVNGKYEKKIPKIFQTKFSATINNNSHSDPVGFILVF